MNVCLCNHSFFFHLNESFVAFKPSCLVSSLQSIEKPLALFHTIIINFTLFSVQEPQVSNIHTLISVSLFIFCGVRISFHQTHWMFHLKKITDSLRYYLASFMLVNGKLIKCGDLLRTKRPSTFWTDWTSLMTLLQSQSNHLIAFQGTTDFHGKDQRSSGDFQYRTEQFIRSSNSIWKII